MDFTEVNKLWKVSVQNRKNVVSFLYKSAVLDCISATKEGGVFLKKNKYEIDMCNGTIMDKLISFSLPLMVSGILQLMFNAVDIIVVGQFT